MTGRETATPRWNGLEGFRTDHPLDYHIQLAQEKSALDKGDRLPRWKFWCVAGVAVFTFFIGVVLGLEPLRSAVFSSLWDGTSGPSFQWTETKMQRVSPSPPSAGSFARFSGGREPLFSPNEGEILAGTVGKTEGSKNNSEYYNNYGSSRRGNRVGRGSLKQTDVNHNPRVQEGENRDREDVDHGTTARLEDKGEGEDETSIFSGEEGSIFSLEETVVPSQGEEPLWPHAVLCRFGSQGANDDTGCAGWECFPPRDCYDGNGRVENGIVLGMMIHRQVHKHFSSPINVCMDRGNFMGKGKFLH
ncbi:hypothetical protein [Pasteuria penetrans]|uniref:hypothetical protein n=1 Tax=Pasteuria penetrans TaxID=86005 RepID=UPI000F97C840|nr:hypothetical protein [Pasteuria penetrans]